MRKRVIFTIGLITILLASCLTSNANAQWKTPKDKKIFNTEEPLTIGISYNQIMVYLDQYISMSKSSDIDGQPRYNGKTSDDLAFLEIIGNKKDVSQAGLMFGIPTDAPTIVVRNTGLLIRFMKNVVPEWKGGWKWVTSAIERMSSTGGSEKIIMGRKLIEVTQIKVYGIVCVSVKHKNAI